jgi:hypothetical protein
VASTGAKWTVALGLSFALGLFLLYTGFQDESVAHFVTALIGGVLTFGSAFGVFMLWQGDFDERDRT